MELHQDQTSLKHLVLTVKVKRKKYINDIAVIAGNICQTCGGNLNYNVVMKTIEINSILVIIAETRYFFVVFSSWNYFVDLYQC